MNGSLEEIDIVDIDSSTHQLRTTFGNLDELVESIRKIGLLQPIVVRANRSNNFEFGKFLRLKDGDSKFYFMHGYHLEVISSLEPLTIEDYENVCANLCDRTNNIIGRTLSALWSLFQGLNFSKPSLEKIEMITKSP